MYLRSQNAGYWCGVLPFHRLALLQQLPGLATYKETHTMKNVLFTVVLLVLAVALFYHRSSIGLVLGLLCLYLSTMYGSRAFYEVRTWWRER